jgi:hypothetical protein
LRICHTQECSLGLSTFSARVVTVEHHFVSMDLDLKLAVADGHIEDAERNIRQVEALLPWLTAQGYSTVEIENQLGLMSEALYHLKEQRRLIVSPYN